MTSQQLGAYLSQQQKKTKKNHDTGNDRGEKDAQCAVGCNFSFFLPTVLKMIKLRHFCLFPSFTIFLLSLLKERLILLTGEPHAFSYWSAGGLKTFPADLTQ